MLETRCHCGDVTILLPRRPRVITACNCSLCRRIRPLFAYYVARTIEIRCSGRAPDSYVWGAGVLRWFRCSRCGCFTHHHPAGREADLGLRSGVNLALVVQPELLAGVTVNLRDGAADTWTPIGSHRFEAEGGVHQRTAP